AAVGLYGVMSYSVSERTREFGVRMALGASPGDVLGLVFREGLWLTLAGLGLGLLCALGLTRVLASLLFGVRASAPASFALAAVVLAATGLGACYMPAWRSTRLQPVRALREE